MKTFQVEGLKKKKKKTSTGFTPKYKSNIFWKIYNNLKVEDKRNSKPHIKLYVSGTVKTITEKNLKRQKKANIIIGRRHFHYSEIET